MGGYTDLCETCYVVKVGFKFQNLLHQPPRCWDYITIVNPEFSMSFDKCLTLFYCRTEYYPPKNHLGSTSGADRTSGNQLQIFFVLFLLFVYFFFLKALVVFPSLEHRVVVITQYTTFLD